MKHFCRELEHYNKTHRLIGNVPCETLLEESKQAIANSEKELRSYTLMIDVGAGSGILAQAWLESKMNRLAILMEPEKKAQAFLQSFFASEPRARVSPERLEAFSLERFSEFTVDPGKMFLATRAFSSNDSLENLYKKSALPFPLFVFDEHDEKFFLTKMK